MPLAKAREIGALALFGETYDEQTVRVVEMGGPWSRELCGGTHVQHSSQIGLVTITGESSRWGPASAGSRRSSASRLSATSPRSARWCMGLTDALKVQPDQLPDRVNKLVAQLKEAEKQIADLKSQTVLADVGSIVAKSHDMWGVGYIAHRADGVTGNDLRSLALEIRNRVQDTASVIAVVGGAADKPSVVIVTTQGARDRGLDAGELVRVASETLGGRGGGKDDIAQGGGTDGSPRGRRPQGRGVRHRARAAVLGRAVSYSFGEALGSGLAKTWWLSLVGRQSLYSSSFKHLRFSLARCRALRLRVGRAASRLQRVPRRGHGFRSRASRGSREPPLAISALRVPAGQAGWSGMLLGVGKT